MQTVIASIQRHGVTIRLPESFKTAIDEEEMPDEFWGAVDAAQQDVLSGVEKFTQLAASGSILSMYMLGDIYFWSYRDLRQGDPGLRWLRRAAECGSIEAAYQLARAYRAMKDETAAIDMFMSLADQGYSPAMFQLGAIYQRQKNLDMCERFYRLGYEAGNLSAGRNLSVLMKRGKFGFSKIIPGFKLLQSMFYEYTMLVKRYPESDRLRGGGKITGSGTEPVLRAATLLLV